MSRTVTTYPITSALKRAEDILGEGSKWNPLSEMQRNFLEIFFTPQVRDEAVRLEEADKLIESVASWDAAEINSFLKTRNFQIALDPFREHEFGAASVLDLLVEWLDEGESFPLPPKDPDMEGERYPGVKMTKSISFSRDVTQKRLGAPILTLHTKTGDRVHLMVPHGNLPEGDFELVQYAMDQSSGARPCTDFENAYFPKVDLDHEADISWLKKLQIEPTALEHEQEISQALQQTKLKMNEKGARVRSAVAIGVMRTTSVGPRPKPPLIINEPFLCWVERPGYSRPIFVGYITEEDWKDPQGLGS